MSAVMQAAQHERQRLGEAVAEMVRRDADMPAPGLVRLAPRLLTPSDRAAALYALRILLAVTGGVRHLPDAERSAELFDRLATDQHGRATLSRCVADRRASGLYLYRELRDLPVLALDGRETIWDGRFRISGDTGWIVRPAEAGDPAIGPAPDGVPQSIVRAALATQPVVLPASMYATGERFAGAEARRSGLGAGTSAVPKPILAPWNLFLPDFDLAPASAIARLIGAPSPPPSPFTGHKDISA
ncbi:MAG: hypothetical protein JNL61_18600 [Rhizobiaceae bacterium]|nr:hypothetical protein [Rhizobiaceae bacterium]